MTKRQSLVYMILAGLFISLHMFAPIAGSKIGIVAGVTFGMGVVYSALTFPILDVINDWQDREHARELATATLIVRTCFLFVLIPLLFVFPAKSEPADFSSFLTQSAQLYAAGLGSFFVGTWLVNVSLFSWFKEQMRGRWFVLRYVVVTLPTIVATSATYTVIGYWGKDVIGLFYGALAVRIIASLVLSPVAWALRRAVKYA